MPLYDRDFNYAPMTERERRLYDFLNEEDYMIPNNTSKEPALVVGTATGTVSGLFFILQYFFPEMLNERQSQFLLVAVSFLLPILTAAFTRGKVWSPASVQEELDKAVQNAKDEINKNPRQGPTTKNPNH